MTVKMRIVHTKEGDLEQTVELEKARERVEQAIQQGWLVTRTFRGETLVEVQVKKAAEVQDGDQLLMTPAVAGG